jgi:hypothetical protein
VLGKQWQGCVLLLDSHCRLLLNRVDRVWVSAPLHACKASDYHSLPSQGSTDPPRQPYKVKACLSGIAFVY